VTRTSQSSPTPPRERIRAARRLAFGELLTEIEDDPTDWSSVCRNSIHRRIPAARPGRRERLVVLVTGPDRAIVVLALAKRHMLECADLPGAPAVGQCMADAIAYRRGDRHLRWRCLPDAPAESLCADLVLDLIEP